MPFFHDFLRNTHFTTEFLWHQHTTWTFYMESNSATMKNIYLGLNRLNRQLFGKPTWKESNLLLQQAKLRYYSTNSRIFICFFFPP